MTQTLRRELKLKFLGIISNYLDNVIIAEADSSEMIEKLVDVALEERRKPAVDLKNSDPAWSILAGVQVDTTENIEAKNARDAFERDMRFNPLPWGMNKQWDKLEKFIIQEHKKDALIFSKYKTWQENDGKYVALSNRKIKDKPEDFIACFPDFLAHVEMYGKPKQEGGSGYYA